MKKKAPNQKRFTFNFSNDTIIIVAAFIAIAIVFAAFMMSLSDQQS